jgi:hypothetical protein
LDREDPIEKEVPVRRVPLRAAVGLSLALVAGWSLQFAHGSDLKGADPRTGKVPPAVKAPAKPADKAADCGCTKTHGTNVQFFDTPSEAATQAKKEQKLVFVLHISGDFENPDFT